MEIKKIINNDTIILELDGKLDKYTSQLLENKIVEVLIEIENKKLEINMANVTYLSSAGLRVLLNTHKELKGKLIVTHIRDEIREIFEITGFIQVLTVE